MGLRRLITGLVCAVLIGSGAPAATVAPAPTPPRIVAIGDLHGDYDAWRAILAAAGLTDAEGRWSGGTTTLVQTGDITDRGPDSLKIIRHMMELEREAARAKGRVVILVGNHEAMNVTGDLRYVSAGEYAAFADDRSAKRRDILYANNQARIEAFYRARDASLSSTAIRAAWIATMPLGKAEHQAAWRPDGELGRWTIARPAVAVIGDSLFVHGGISQRIAALPVDEINRRVAAALTAADLEPDAIINADDGPLWYRGLVVREPAENRPPPPSASRIAPTVPTRPSMEEELGIALKAYGVKRIVVGHTPALKGIAVLSDGRLIRIDTGISKVYGGTLSYLELIGDEAVPHIVERSR